MKNLSQCFDVPKEQHGLHLGVWGLMGYSIFYQYLQGHGCENPGNPLIMIFSRGFYLKLYFPGGKFAQLQCKFHSGWEIEKIFQVSFFFQEIESCESNITIILYRAYWFLKIWLFIPLYINEKFISSVKFMILYKNKDNIVLSDKIWPEIKIPPSKLWDLEYWDCGGSLYKHTNVVHFWFTHQQMQWNETN